MDNSSEYSGYSRSRQGNSRENDYYRDRQLQDQQEYSKCSRERLVDNSSDYSRRTAPIETQTIVTHVTDAWPIKRNAASTVVIVWTRRAITGESDAWKTNESTADTAGSDSPMPRVNTAAIVGARNHETKEDTVWVVSWTHRVIIAVGPGDTMNAAIKTQVATACLSLIVETIIEARKELLFIEIESLSF